MNRRSFLQLTGLTVTSAFFNAECRKNDQTGLTAKRPNILLITTDQQSWLAMSCTGNPYVKTPAIDRLASMGMRFENVYVTQPLCMPSRSSIQTGHYPHEIDAPDNRSSMKEGYPLLARIMTDHGYDCALFGKWHIAVVKEDVERHGYADCDQSKDDKLPKLVRDYFSSGREKPFFLMVSFVNPHNVCQLSRGEELPDGPIPDPPPADQCPPLPDNFGPFENEPDAPDEVKKIFTRIYPTTKWGETQWRQYLWGYYRIVEKVDALIGVVLDALEQSKYFDNTVIMFTSDHGEGIAAHHWNQKQVLYEETTRVPLIMAKKNLKKAGTTEDRFFVSTGIDLMPTILDFAGIPVPESLPGLSLKPALDGGRMPERDYIVVETAFAEADVHAGYYGRMIRTHQFKYIVYNKGSIREQLFDMNKDPGETNNLAFKDEYHDVLVSLRFRLTEWAKKTNDNFPFMT